MKKKTKQIPRNLNVLIARKKYSGPMRDRRNRRPLNQEQQFLEEDFTLDGYNSEEEFPEIK